MGDTAMPDLSHGRADADQSIHGADTINASLHDAMAELLASDLAMDEDSGVLTPVMSDGGTILYGEERELWLRTHYAAS